MRSLARVCAVAVLLGLGGAVPAAAAAAPAALPPGYVSVAGDPAHITAVKVMSQRAITLTISTPAFSVPTHVDVDLPTGYASQPKRRWPVTYILAGIMNSYSSLNNKGHSAAVASWNFFSHFTLASTADPCAPAARRRRPAKHHRRPAKHHGRRHARS